MEQPIDPKLQILSNMYSVEDAAEFVESIDEFLASIYKTEQKSIADLLDASFSDTMSKVIKDYLSTTKTSLTNQEEVRQILLQIQNFAKDARSLSLTLAFKPSAKSFLTIAQTIKQRFGDDVVLEMTTNPDLVGGAVIIFEGKYIDLTVKKKLDILFEVKKEEILKILA